jgi:hypothetical protein
VVNLYFQVFLGWGAQFTWTTSETDCSPILLSVTDGSAIWEVDLGTCSADPSQSYTCTLSFQSPDGPVLSAVPGGLNGENWQSCSIAPAPSYTLTGTAVTISASEDSMPADLTCTDDLADTAFNPCALTYSPTIAPVATPPLPTSAAAPATTTTASLSAEVNQCDANVCDYGVSFVFDTKDQDGHDVTAVGDYVFNLYINGIVAESGSIDGTVPANTFGGIGATGDNVSLIAEWEPQAGGYGYSSVTAGTIALASGLERNAG